MVYIYHCEVCMSHGHFVNWFVCDWISSPCRCDILTQLLNEDEYFKLPWQAALQWLQSEMDRVGVMFSSTLPLLFIALLPSLPVASFTPCSVSTLAPATTTRGGLLLPSPMRHLMGSVVIDSRTVWLVFSLLCYSVFVAISWRGPTVQG